VVRARLLVPIFKVRISRKKNKNKNLKLKGQKGRNIMNENFEVFR
jgi:hypothetical protein